MIKHLNLVKKCPNKMQKRTVLNLIELHQRHKRWSNLIKVENLSF